MPLDKFRPSSASFVNHICNLCFMFIFSMLSCLFLAALWPPAGKGLTSWLSFMLCVLVLCYFPIPYGVPGQVWFLIVSFPDFYCPLFFYVKIPRLQILTSEHISSLDLPSIHQTHLKTIPTTEGAVRSWSSLFSQESSKYFCRIQKQTNFVVI